MGGGGGLNREGGLLIFFPEKGGLLEGGGLNRGFTRPSDITRWCDFTQLTSNHI